MPRIYAQPGYTGFERNDVNDPCDFCKDCFDPPEEYLADGGSEHGDEHPDYGECDYRCETCKKPLTDEDN